MNELNKLINQQLRTGLIQEALKGLDAATVAQMPKAKDYYNPKPKASAPVQSKPAQNQAAQGLKGLDAATVAAMPKAESYYNPLPKVSAPIQNTAAPAPTTTQQRLSPFALSSGMATPEMAQAYVKQFTPVPLPVPKRTSVQVQAELDNKGGLFNAWALSSGMATPDMVQSALNAYPEISALKKEQKQTREWERQNLNLMQERAMMGQGAIALPNAGGQWQGYDDLIQYAQSKPGQLGQEDSRKVKNAILELRRMAGLSGNPGDLEYFMSVSPQDRETARQYLLALSEIPLSGAGNKIENFITSAGANAVGTGIYALETVGQAARNAYENLTNEELQKEYQTFLGGMYGGDAAGAQEAINRAKGLRQNKAVDVNSLGSQILELGQKEAYKMTYKQPEPVKLLGEAALSTANYLGTLAIAGGNPMLALGLMGVQSFANTAYDVAKKGGTMDEQMIAGIVSGLIEAATEKLPLDSLLKIAKGNSKGLLKWLTNLVKQSGIEAVEEGVNYGAGYLANKLILGGKADEFDIEEMFRQMAIGGLSGGFMGAGAGVVSRAGNAGTYTGTQNTAQTQAQTQPVPLPIADPNDPIAQRIRGQEQAQAMPDVNAMTWEEINAMPQVVQARILANFEAPTLQIDTPERWNLRRQIADKLMQQGSYSGVDANGNELYNGAVRQGRRADIVIGPPAAGKSSVLANPLSQQHQSRIIDSDMAKAMLPEYNGGYGAGRVHEESARITEYIMMDEATANGDNIVIPWVGKSPEKIRSKLKELKQQGYEVYLHLNELDADKAARRAVVRFLETGRFVDPNYVRSVGNKPSEVYEQLKQEGGFDGYQKYSNDVPKGQMARRIERIYMAEENRTQQGIRPDTPLQDGRMGGYGGGRSGLGVSGSQVGTTVDRGVAGDATEQNKINQSTTAGDTSAVSFSNAQAQQPTPVPLPIAGGNGAAGAQNTAQTQPVPLPIAKPQQEQTAFPGDYLTFRNAQRRINPKMTDTQIALLYQDILESQSLQSPQQENIIKEKGDVEDGGQEAEAKRLGGRRPGDGPSLDREQSVGGTQETSTRESRPRVGEANRQNDTENRRVVRRRKGDKRALQIGEKQYGYKVVKGKEITKTAREVLAYWESLGLECDITDGALYTKDKNGMKKSTGWEGKKLPDGTLLISNNTDLSAKETSRHEVIHAMKTLEPELFEYIDNVLYDSGMDVAKGIKTLRDITEAYKVSHPEIDDINNLDYLREEILAFISGMHADNPTRARKYFEPLVNEYDAVVAAIEEGLAEFEGRRMGRPARSKTARMDQETLLKLGSFLEEYDLRRIDRDAQEAVESAQDVKLVDEMRSLESVEQAKQAEEENLEFTMDTFFPQNSANQHRKKVLSTVKEYAGEPKREQKRATQKTSAQREKEAQEAARSISRYRNKAVEDLENAPVDTIKKEPPTKEEKRLKEGAKTLKDMALDFHSEVYRLFVNDVQEIDNFSKYQKEGVTAGEYVNIVRSANSTIETIFEKGLINRQGDTIGPALKDVMLMRDEKGRLDKGKQAMLQDYMLHKHNIDRMGATVRAREAIEAYEKQHPTLRKFDPQDIAYIIKSGRDDIVQDGITLEIAQEYARLADEVDAAQNKPIFADENGKSVTSKTSRIIAEAYEKAAPWLKEKSEEINDYWDKFMREWVVGELISEESYEAMRALYPNYVPTYRVDKRQSISGGYVGMGNASVKAVVKKAKGGHSEVMPIEDSFANLIAKYVRQSRLNELYLNILESAQNDRETFKGFAATDSETLPDMEGDAQEISEAYARQALEDLGNGAYKMHAWKKGERISATISKQMYRALNAVTVGGTQDEAVNKGIRLGQILTNPMKTMITGINPIFGLRNVERDLPTAVINSISGVQFFKYYAQAANEMARRSDNWRRFQALGGTHAGYYNQNQGFAKSISKGRNPASKVVKGLGVVNDTLEAQTRFAEYLATIDKLGDTYEGRLKGIKNAAEVTVDFGRHGALGVGINAWIPYWNPAVQGIDKTIRSVVGNEATMKAVAKQAGVTISRALIMAALPEALLYAVRAGLGVDDDYDELDDRTKDTYFCIPVPWLKEGEFLKVPKNREWGALLSSTLGRIIQGLNGRSDPFENYLTTAIIPNFLPPGPLEAFPISIMHDLAANKDFAGRAIVPASLQNLSPENQWDEDTSRFAVELGKRLKFSPKQIDYIIKDYCGDFGKTFINLTKVGNENNESIIDTMGYTLSAITNPFVANRIYSNAVVDEFYDTYNEITTAYYDSKLESGDKYQETKEYQIYNAMNKYYKEISEINKAVRGLSKEKMSKEERDAKKESMKLDIIQIATEALDFKAEVDSGKITNPALTYNYREDGLSEQLTKELIRLDKYTKDYQIKPVQSAPQYINTRNSFYRYELDDAQKAQYKLIYNNIYDTEFTKLINSASYKSSDDKQKLKKLEKLRDEVGETARKDMNDWLKESGATATRKKKER